MNSKIKLLISNIEYQFKLIYKRDLNEFTQITVNYENVSFTVVNLDDFTSDEIEFLLEKTLLGIKYYLENFIPQDKEKYGFPLIVFKSIINVIENKENKILIYTKRFPSFNKDLEYFLNKKNIELIK